MAPLNQFPKIQPQIAQLECLFRGPLVKDSAVNTFNDLLQLKPQYNYHHKLVWVRDQAANYYLADGDGTVAANWKRTISRAVINRYDQNESYQAGESVYLSGKIYSAKQSVPEFYTPLSYPLYWKVISGETITYRYLFTQVSSIIVYTEIRNPIFEIMLGTIEYDENMLPIIDEETGLIKISNAEIVEAAVVERIDLPKNNGAAYEVKFFENEELSVQVSGVINVK